jgi:plasmid replication initiation protein
MIKLGTVFTRYKLANILSMKSKYSPRIYEILKCNQFKEQKGIEIEIDELRKLLKAESVYPKYNDFKRYIVERTQKELKKISDIRFDFEEIKTGRKVTALKFYIKPNITANKEVSATKTDAEPTVSKEELSEDMKFGVKKVMELITEPKISEVEALKIFKSSKGDFAVIQRVYSHFIYKQLDSFVGTMISMVKPGVFHEPKANAPKNTFNDYEQRKYDYNELEKKLLGWDEEVDI